MLGANSNANTVHTHVVNRAAAYVSNVIGNAVSKLEKQRRLSGFSCHKMLQDVFLGLTASKEKFRNCVTV